MAGTEHRVLSLGWLSEVLTRSSRQSCSPIRKVCWIRIPVDVSNSKGLGQRMKNQVKRESVWDYPRPPRVESYARTVAVKIDVRHLAETTRAVRVLETSHPPVFYIPPEDIDMRLLEPNLHSTFCEFKGRAEYFDLRSPERSVRNVAWTYLDPSAGYERLRGMVAFYPGKVDCFVAGEPVCAQVGGFYGGWITRDIEGPFKGGPGTLGW